MSHSTTPTKIQLDKQELHEFVNKSSKWCMKTKGDVKEYATIFWYCCNPLITSHYMSLGECEELFWQGFHPNTRAQFPPDAKQQIWDILQRTPTNDLVASTPAAPANPSPSLPPASDLITCPWPALATTTPLTSAAPMLCHPISVLPPSPAHNILLLPPTLKQPSSVPPPSQKPILSPLPSPLPLPTPTPMPLPLPLPPTPTVHELPPPLLLHSEGLFFFLCLPICSHHVTAYLISHLILFLLT